MTDELEEQYRTLYENALVGLWTSRIEGGSFIRANNTAAKIAGYEDAEDLMNNCDAIKLFDYETRVEFIRELREHGVKSGFEAILIDKKNNIKEITVSGKINLEKGTIEGVFIDISDLKETEKALKESEENYRRITEQSLMGIAIFQEGKIKYINKAFAEIAGYSIEEILNWPKNYFAKTIHPDDLPVVMQEMQGKLIDGKDITSRYPFRIIAKSGKIKWIELYSKSIFYQGKLAILATAIEITERINAEQKLLDSEEKFRTITEQALMGIAIIQDNVVKYVNKQFADLLGYEVEEIKSWSPTGFIETVHPEDKEMVMKHAELRQAGLYDDVNHYFYRGLTKTADIVWFEVFAKTIIYEGRSADLVTIIDISETKEAEDKLSESEEKYRNIIENTKEGYFEVDLKGNMTFFNDALWEWTGYSREELLGMNYNDYMTEENAKRTFKAFNEVYNTGITQRNFQYDLIRKDGKHLIGESSVYLRYDSNGNKIGFNGFLRDITEKREAEQKLKESEENYRSIFNSSPDYIYVTDMRGDFLEANQVFLDRIKLPLEELRGMNFIDFYAGEKLPEILGILKNLRYGEQVKGLEVKAKTPFGERMDLEVNSVPITEDGKVTKVISIARDLSERKIAEQKLKESEEKYRDMIHNLDLGFYRVKWDGTILNVNPEFRRIMGFGQFEDLSNINIKDFWRNEEELMKYSEELLKNNVVDNYIGHGKNKYGEELILQTDSHLIRDENGKPIRVEGTVIDITDKFKLEQKLKESEIRYRSLFEKSPLAIILSDSNGVIRDANPSTETLIGYKEAEIVGRAFTNLSLVHPDHLPLIMKRTQRLFSGLKDSGTEVQYYHKDGRLLWAHIIATLIKSGDETFIQVIAHDVTERKTAELLIKEEVEKLKELDQMRKDLISRVSHELKTPLIPVMGGAELLLDSYKDQFESEPLEIIEMIEKGGKRLAKLVEKLLDITKIEYEKFELEKQRTNLSEIIRGGVRDMKFLIEKREIDLNLVVPDNFYMEIDGFRIEQVLTNLLSNAIKNTPPKGRIGVMIEKIGNWAIISVSDTGVGFTEDETKKLFTRFGKFERYGEGLEYIDMEGSGLGLYISKQIVDLHKGKIWVESTGRNRGCIIKVRLPIF